MGPEGFAVPNRQSMLIASEGQLSTQTPQSMHASASMQAFSSTIFIASLGQS
jgi:hypothetical protein